MKLHLIFFSLLVLLLPTQIGYHFWPDWALVFGIRVDYLSPTVYLTDILIFLTLITFTIAKPKKVFKFLWSNLVYIAILVVFLVINVLNANIREAAAYGSVRIIEMAALSAYVLLNCRGVKKIFPGMLAIAVSYTAILAFLQVYLGRSIGGPLYYLGERNFAATTPGISLVHLFGKTILRPYATFGHPNALGGFLAASLPLITSEAFLLGILGTALSFSRSAIGAAFFSPILAKFSKWLPVILASLSLLALVLVFPANLINLGGESAIKRVELASAAREIFLGNPVTGVGAKNFIPSLVTTKANLGATTVWFLQPVHNIFLLGLTEFGIFGLFGFVIILSTALYRASVSKNINVAISLTAILLTGFTDHYSLTLEQNMLFFAILIGVAYGKNSNHFLRRRSSR